MRINERHILVLTLDEWKAAGISIDSFKQAKSRGQLKATRACKGKPAEIEYESLPERFKEAIDAHFGDPFEYLKNTALKQYLNSDERAFEFYATHEIEPDVYLPQDNQDQYCESAKWLNLALDLDKGKPTKQLAKQYTANKWESFLDLAKKSGVKIPYSYSKFRKLLNDYAGPNYEALISKKFGNSNTQKITSEGAQFLVAHYALPTKMKAEKLWALYNSEALKHGWKPLKDARTVYAFLSLPNIKPQWEAGRNGQRKATQKYGYSLRTLLPTFRDALWYSDGTKLNFYYLDEERKMKADLTVYEIMDVYSEVMLGCSIGKTENYDLMYKAARMAIQTSQAKPYEWKYDNQGGHTKLQNEGFLGKLARVSVNTQPYNAKSKTIESAFGRFQQYVMRELWFFTGQNVKTKATDSEANMEFILKNKSKLPTRQQAIEAYIACRNKWNNGIHHAEPLPRIELYKSSVNPESRPIGYLDTIEMFWLTKEKPITYFNHGITVTHNKQKFEYEVLADGMPDMEFRKNYIDQRFIVKYDPDNMTHIRLYLDKKDAGLQFVAIAQPRLTVHRAIQDQEPGERELINKLLDVRKQETERLASTIPEVIINDDHTLSVASWQKKLSYMIEEEADDYTNYL